MQTVRHSVASSVTGASAEEAGHALPIREPARYVRGREIARGGMGRIVSAYDRELDRRVAIKELLSLHRTAEQRFEREVRITARLQHPSIIAVQEAGRWPTGEPFYAMQHLDGQPLGHAIDDAAPSQRLALVRHVLAVADAMAYAHDRGVIHRDLKPANILVGTFGETVVIDWGLAKQLGELEVAIAGEIAHGSDEGLTVVGQALGTPSYMSPQQAAGEQVDERADVYALGAILYHVLAGRMPYAEHRSAEDVRQAVLEGPPEALETLAPSTPPDLLAIVATAMARDPAQRYATAAGVSADLKRFTTGQLVGAHRYSVRELVARWIRRHRGAVVVAGIATVALIAGGIVGVQQIRGERDTAEVERAAAQTHRAETEELLDFMLADLAEKLETVGRLDLLDAVAKRAVAHYAAVPTDEADLRAVHKRGVAFRNLGRVAKGRGDYAGALAAYQTSQTLAEKLIAIEPGNAEWHSALAFIHSEIGRVELMRGNVDGALASYGRALAISQTFVARDPASTDWQTEVFKAQMAISDVRAMQGRFSEAEAATRAAVAVTERLVARAPNEHKWHDMLATSRTGLASSLQSQQDYAGALAVLRASLPTVERAVANDPANRTWSPTLAGLHLHIGEALLSQGSLDEALAAFRSCTAAVEWAAKEPADGELLIFLTACYAKSGHVLHRQKRLAEAIATIRAGLAISEQTAAAQPTNTHIRRMLVHGLFELAHLLHRQRDFDGVVTTLERVLVIADAALEREPAVVDWLTKQYPAHREIGTILANRGQYAEARSRYARAIAIAERVVAIPDLRAVHGPKLQELREFAAIAARKDKPPRRPKASR